MKPLIIIVVLVSLLLVLPAYRSTAGPAPGTFVMVITDNPDNLNPYLAGLAASSTV